MKNLKAMVMALPLLVGLGLTSCMGESTYTPQWGGAAEVINWMGATQFKDVSGLTIIPTTSSVESIKSSMGFNPSNTNMAYIMYSYDQEGNENMATTGKIYNAQLLYAVSLDGTTEYVSVEGSSNDSISTAPIIALEDVMTSAGTQPLSLVRNRFLMTGVNYIFNAKLHHFTLIYNPNEQEDGKLKFELRHSGTPEASTVTTTSKTAFNVGLPYVYLKSFDIRDYLSQAISNSSTPTITIEVKADVNTRNNELDGTSTEPKTYTLVYDPSESL